MTITRVRLADYTRRKTGRRRDTCTRQRSYNRIWHLYRKHAGRCGIKLEWHTGHSLQGVNVGNDLCVVPFWLYIFPEWHRRARPVCRAVSATYTIRNGT